MSEDKIYWSDLAELNHGTQLAQFGWCRCEDDEPPYDDCPKEGESDE